MGPWARPVPTFASTLAPPSEHMSVRRGEAHKGAATCAQPRWPYQMCARLRGCPQEAADPEWVDIKDFHCSLQPKKSF